MNGGLLLVNKEKNISSNKVDSKIKRALSYHKVGHLGTLDPLATGLMVVLLGDSTKLAKYFDDSTKEYLLRVRLGATSDSLDYETPLKDLVDANLLGEEERIDSLLLSFMGKITQTPPLYSAIKVNGEKLYRMANDGIMINVIPREVEVFEIKRVSPISYHDGSSYFDLIVDASKGFYVRSLAKDIGRALNIPAMSDFIKRLKVGNFRLEDAYTVDDIQAGNYKLLNPFDYLEMEEIKANEKMTHIVLNGGALSKSMFKSQNRYKVYSPSNELLAIYCYSQEKDCFVMDCLVKK